MSDGEAIKTGLPPVARPDARLLILGSLPGDASLAAARYYAHPTNQFWRLLGGALGEPLETLAYDVRLALLIHRKIALWDVIGSAVRRGSLDQAIRNAEHNRLGHFVASLPDLRAIAFNGNDAARRGRVLLGPGLESFHLINLPSSSAANTRRFVEKAAAWNQLAQFIGT